MSIVLAFVFAILGWCGPAFAQLPPDVYNTPRPLTSEQVSTLKSYVEQNIMKIKSRDSRELADARRSLLDPFRRDTSRTFRMAYNDALSPELAKLAQDEAAAMATRQAAIQILGSVASDDSDSALRSLLSSDLPAIRYAVATAYERSMMAIRQDRHSYSNPLQGEKNVARYLREAIGVESNGSVLRALASAASTLPTASNAIDALADGLAAQVRSLKDGSINGRLEGVRLGLERMQKRYVVDMFGGQAIAAHERKMIEAAASALLLTVRHGAARKVSSANQSSYSELARTSENLLNLLTKRDGTQTRVASAVAAGRYDEADSAMTSLWLAADGPIYTNRLWEIPAGAIEKAFDR